ncbi:MAG: endonuclease V [Pseudomonadota bacterium]
MILASTQRVLGRAVPEPWLGPVPPLKLGGVFMCFPRGRSNIGAQGDRVWVAAVVMEQGRVVSQALVEGVARPFYEPGLLAMREGPLLEAAVRALDLRPDLLLVNATGRDHPRRGGLAVHLGAMLNLPTVGVTHRPLYASGPWPAPLDGADAPLRLDGETIGYWLRPRGRWRPIAVHAGWRVSAAVARAVVAGLPGRARTPEPLRQARRLARDARSAAGQG